MLLLIIDVVVSLVNMLFDEGEVGGRVSVHDTTVGANNNGQGPRSCLTSYLTRFASGQGLSSRWWLSLIPSTVSLRLSDVLMLP